MKKIRITILTLAVAGAIASAAVPQAAALDGGFIRRPVKASAAAPQVAALDGGFIRRPVSI
jgi:hypothetical protein